MPFFGDPYPADRWYGDMIVIPMSTALFKIYTSQGFVLAADGLKQKIADDGTTTPESDSCQKIFRIKQPARSLAYSLTGTVQLTGESGQKAGFDFAARARDAMKAMAKSEARDLEAYATEICASIKTLLDDAKTSGRVERYPTPEVQWEGETGHTILEILFDGYYQGDAAIIASGPDFFTIIKSLLCPKYSRK